MHRFFTLCSAYGWLLVFCFILIFLVAYRFLIFRFSNLHHRFLYNQLTIELINWVSTYWLHIINSFVCIFIICCKVLFFLIFCLMESDLYLFFIWYFQSSKIFLHFKNTACFQFQIFCFYHFICIQFIFYLFV